MKAPLITLCLSFTAFSELKTEVPPLRPSAKTAAVERAKIHLAALDGDLEVTPLWSSTRGPCGGQTSRRPGTRMNSSWANIGARA
jgi:hypothetical protein